MYNQTLNEKETKNRVCFSLPFKLKIAASFWNIILNNDKHLNDRCGESF